MLNTLTSFFSLGRTGRAGQEGMAITYYTNADAPYLGAGSALQAGILLGMGLQRKPVEIIARELGLEVSQVLALFQKTVRRLAARLHDIQRAGVVAAEEKEGGGPDVDAEAAIDSGERIDQNCIDRSVTGNEGRRRKIMIREDHSQFHLWQIT